MPLSRRGFGVALLARIVALTVLCASLIGLSPGMSSAATTWSPGEQRGTELVNRSRSSAGLRALAPCADLVEIARTWSKKMATSGNLAHNPSARDQIAGWSAWGENVGVGSSVDEVHGAFMRSSGHRANLESSNYAQVGVGVATGNGRTWVTQVFRKPKAGQGCTAPRVPAPAPVPLPDSVDRIQGANRYETAAALSKAAFPSASTVIIASAERYPDALAAAPLSAKTGAPILLTAAGGLHEAAENEIRRLRPSKAIVLGSTRTLSTQVDKDLSALNLTVERLAGADRYETAAKIATQVGGSTIVMAKGTGQGWADAIAATGYAAHRQRPILLVDGVTVAPPTWKALDKLGVSTVEIIGGAAAVSPGIEDQLTSRGITVRRLAGADRLATSAKVADASVAAGMSATTVWVATARNWADALSAGPAVARRGDVLLLANPDRVSTRQATGQWLDRRAAAVQDIVLVGGRTAVHDQVGHDVAQIVK